MPTIEESVPQKKTIRIGISGISTSGKTTIVKAIQSLKQCGVAAGDDFYIRDGSVPKIDHHGVVVPNWDDPRSIDWKLFHKSIVDNTNSLVIVDSFQLFYNKDIVESIDAAIVIEYTADDFDVAMERRMLRHTGSSAPADYRENPNATVPHFEASYFSDVVWKTAFDRPEYWDDKTWTGPVLRLRATSSITENISEALSFVENLQNKIQ